MVSGTLAVLIHLALADDCSLLMIQNEWNTGYFETMKAGGADTVTCTPQKGGFGSSTHDNTLGFQVCAFGGSGSEGCPPPEDRPKAQMLLAPTSYGITKGQPVPFDCFSSTPSSFTFKAGRKGSSAARDAFMSGLNSNQIMVSDSYGEVPGDLNFMLEGNISLVFKCPTHYGSELSSIVRFGQGNSGHSNNWWMGGMNCQKSREHLACGSLTFFTSESDQFAVAPSRGWETYCANWKNLNNGPKWPKPKENPPFRVDDPKRVGWRNVCHGVILLSPSSEFCLAPDLIVQRFFLNFFWLSSTFNILHHGMSCRSNNSGLFDRTNHPDLPKDLFRECCSFCRGNVSDSFLPFFLQV